MLLKIEEDIICIYLLHLESLVLGEAFAAYHVREHVVLDSGHVTGQIERVLSRQLIESPARYRDARQFLAPPQHLQVQVVRGINLESTNTNCCIQ
jgi:hypothetical protein